MVQTSLLTKTRPCIEQTKVIRKNHNSKFYANWTECEKYFKLTQTQSVRVSLSLLQFDQQCCPVVFFVFVLRHQKIELTEHLISVWPRTFISGRSGLSTIKKRRASLKTLMSLLWLHSALCMRTHLFFFVLSEMKTIFKTCSCLLSQHYLV